MKRLTCVTSSGEVLFTQEMCEDTPLKTVICVGLQLVGASERFRITKEPKEISDETPE